MFWCVGCDDDELTQELQYDTTTLEDLCNNNTLGNSLLTALSQAEGDLTTNFNTNDYDQTSASLPITAHSYTRLYTITLLLRPALSILFLAGRLYTTVYSLRSLRSLGYIPLLVLSFLKKRLFKGIYPYRG